MVFLPESDAQFVKAAEQYVKDIVEVKAYTIAQKNPGNQADGYMDALQHTQEEEYQKFFVQEFDAHFDTPIQQIRRELGQHFTELIIQGKTIKDLQKILTAKPWVILSYLQNPSAKEVVLNMMHGHLEDATKAKEAVERKKKAPSVNPFKQRAQQFQEDKKIKTKFITVEDSDFGKLDLILREGVLYFSVIDLAKILGLPKNIIDEDWPSHCVEEGKAVVDIIGMAFMLQDAINAEVVTDPTEFMAWMIGVKGSVDDLIEEMFGSFDIFHKALW